jgi:hypothetical protein
MPGLLCLQIAASSADFDCKTDGLLVCFNTVQQMIGRAGRPGFDVEGHAIIMTEVNEQKQLCG